MKIFSLKNILEFLQLSPLNQILYLCYCINCWTSVPRFYVAIKLIRLFHCLQMDFLGNWVGHVSGLNKRLVQQFPDLANDEMRARYLD